VATPDPLEEPRAAVRSAGALRELAAMFLRLGATSFGGPAAHIALMEHEVVARRQWIARDAFMDVVGSVNLIPGPNSTEVAIHVGYARAGWQGLIVAGTCFILPAALLVTALAWSYVRFGTVPALAAVLYGIKPVVLAVIVQAIWRLGRTALTTPRTIAIAVLSVVVSALGVHELIVLAGAALSGLATTWRRQTRLSILVPWDWSSAWRSSHWPLAIAATGVAGSVGLWPLFGVFLKIGSVLFGSGYVLLAFLRADLVERYHWITERQLLDAIAVGQVTPGPLFTSATFIGYVIGGLPGAAVATIGIFLPAFIFVALSGRFLPKLRQNPSAAGFLDGLNAASLALMAVVTAYLAQTAIVDLPTLTLAIAAASVLLFSSLNATWLIAGGALTGWLLY
jgi:chromate transporter